MAESFRFTHAIVMAGASCAGKTTLTARLLAGELPRLSAALNLQPDVAYHVLHAREWSDLDPGSSDRILLQYDLTAQTPFADEGEIRDEALILLKSAERLTVLTVWETPGELGRRLELRFGARGGLAYTLARTLSKGSPRRAWYSLRRFRQRKRLFGQPEGLWALYLRWFSSCTRLQPESHWVIKSTDPEEVTRLPQVIPPAPFWAPGE